MAIQTKPVSNHPDFDAWHDALKADALNYRKSAWKLIDRIGEGRERFGDEMFWQAIHSTGLAESTITNYLSLHKAFPKGLRRETVPLGVHETIRTLSPEQRATILKVADDLNWTREDVRLRMAAFKDGDEKAWDPRWKAHKKTKVIDIVEEPGPAGGNKAGDDAAVFDGTDASAGMDAEIRAANRAEFKEAAGDRPQSTATEKLTFVLAYLKKLRDDPSFRDELDVSTLSASDCNLEGHWLVNLGTEIRHRQNIEFDHPRSAPKAVLSAASAGTVEGEGAGSAARAAPSPTSGEGFDPLRDMPARLRGDKVDG